MCKDFSVSCGQEGGKLIFYTWKLESCLLKMLYKEAILYAGLAPQCKNIILQNK
jgi:hypothetical protein